MNRTTKRILKFATFAACCALALPVVMPRHADAMVHRYSDRQVFEGLVLGHGPVAALIPQMGGGRAWSAAQASAATALETKIAKKQPSFIADFSRDVRSGNPQLVEDALARAAKFVAVTPTKTSDAMVGQIAQVVIVPVTDIDLTNDNQYFAVYYPQPLLGSQPFTREAFARSVAAALQSE